jgi:hypothetical protein
MPAKMTRDHHQLGVAVADMCELMPERLELIVG